MRRDLAQPTPLQVWTIALAELLEDARDTLDDDEYTAFVDLGFRRLLAESVRLGLDDWRAAA